MIALILSKISFHPGFGKYWRNAVCIFQRNDLRYSVFRLKIESIVCFVRGYILSGACNFSRRRGFVCWRIS